MFQDSLTWEDYKATTSRQVYNDSFIDRKVNEMFQFETFKMIGLQVKVKNDYSFNDIAKKLYIYEGFRAVSFFKYFFCKNCCDMEKALTKALGVSFRVSIAYLEAIYAQKSDGNSDLYFRFIFSF